MFGRRFSPTDAVIDIPHATGSGEAIRRHASVSLDTAEWARAERSMEADGFRLIASGSWHAHTATRDGRPSLADLTGWLRMLDYAAEHNTRSRPIHVGLIYCPSFDSAGYESWASPVAWGWIVHREGRYSRTPVYDRLEIRGRA